jgi:prepilin-type processing-associated H-X9-DG protein
VSILVVCECGQQFVTPEENSGREARCSDCGRAITVPPPFALADDEALRFEFVGSPPRSGKAIASLIFGVLSLLVSVVAGIPAIVLGYAALLEIRRSHGRIGGAGMAMAGLATGIVGSTAITLLMFSIVALDVQESTRKAACMNNLKQIALALHNYHSAYQSFPPAVLVDRSRKPLLSWRVAILPYLGQPMLYSRFNLNEPWDSPNNSQLLREMPAVFACPDDPTSGRFKTPFQAIVGKGTIFTGPKPVAMNSILDGTSNTIMVGESDMSVPWSAPQDLSFDLSIPRSGLSSFHPGLFNVAFGDGSVRSIKDTITNSILSALISKRGGEVIMQGSY